MRQQTKEKVSRAKKAAADDSTTQQAAAGDENRAPVKDCIEAQRLAAFIIFKTEGNDDTARAMFKLLDLFVEARNFHARDELRLFAATGAYHETEHCQHGRAELTKEAAGFEPKFDNGEPFISY
jgi:hypothetical protein